MIKKEKITTTIYMKLLRKAVFTLMLVMLGGWAIEAAAQYKYEVKEVDFNEIKEETLDPNSPYYYPKLVSYFNSNDTIMNFKAYRDLYFGFVFQEDYNPFRNTEFEDKEKVEQLYYNSDREPTRDECDEIEKYAVRALADNMFDIDQIGYYIYALQHKKKYARAAVRQYRHDKLIAAIMSSGHGTEEEPWVVIFPEHEYTLINLLGYVAVDHDELQGGIDRIRAKSESNNRETKDFYFDVSQMLREASVKFPEDFE